MKMLKHNISCLSKHIYIYIYTNITNIFMYQHFVHEIFTHTLWTYFNSSTFICKCVCIQICLHLIMFVHKYASR